jgi:membrane-associated phospholipid phosphatase
LIPQRLINPYCPRFSRFALPRPGCALALALTAFLTGMSQAQSKTTPVQASSTTPVTERDFARHLLQDQKQIWTSPFHLKPKDASWLLPGAALLAEGLHRDRYLYGRLSSGDGGTSRRFSDAGVVGLGGVIVGTYVVSRYSRNEHGRETGILGMEALANAAMLNVALKQTLRRQRPEVPGSAGEFFGPRGGSFPSDHAIYAWSMATVLAHEYPGPLTKVAAYGLASAVAVSRVTGRRHFPTDVLVGSALGYGVGRMVYRKHHDPALPGANIGTFKPQDDEEHDFGSVYEPVDSWVYPAFEHLSARGLLRSNFPSVRPWTRAECARLVIEAENETDTANTADLGPLIKALRQEFQRELGAGLRNHSSRIGVDSVYARIGGISGEPLVDGYHFGTTIANDFGRPLANGWNSVAGISGSAEHGRWFAYLRGEHQYAGTLPPLSLAVRQEIARVDTVPVQSAQVVRERNRFRIVEAYAGFNWHGWQFTAGKHALWWGPGESGALNLSNNAESILMARASNSHPIVMPGPFSLLGPVKLELFIGQLGGHRFTRTVNGLFGPELSTQPLIHGEKIVFKPTQNLDLGFSVTTIFGGPGLPLNLRAFFRSFGISNTIPGEAGDPGDRRTGFDFRYRIPGARDVLVLYNDSMSEDEFSPIAYPRRSAMNPGLQISRLPFLQRTDLRLEGFYTDLPNLRGSGVQYFNSRFISGYTNFGQVLGHPVGRDGTGFRIATNSWFRSKDRVQLGFTNIVVSPKFIVGGGRIQDWAARFNVELNSRFSLQATTQYQRHTFPLLQSGTEANVVGQFQLTFRPGQR